MEDNCKDNFQKKLYEAISRGCKALDVAEFLMPILDERRGQLVDKLEKSDFNYQKIDNSELIAIQLELKVIASERRAIKAAISEGVEAESKLRELNEPPKQSKPGIKLKF